MTSNLSVILKKYTVPALFLIIGLVMVYVGIANEQGGAFMLAAIMMLAAGALSIAFSIGKFKSSLVYILGIGAGIAGLVALFMSYESVESTMTYQQNAENCHAIAVQNLQDIRYVQKEYKEKTGKYIGDWSKFKDFVKNGEIPVLESQGNVPGRKIDPIENNYLYTGNPPIDIDMTEQEAYRLSKWTEGPFWERDFKFFRRDTVLKPIMDVKFNTISYTSNRAKLGFYKFNADSLPVIPHTTKEWTLETKDSVKIGDESFPTIRVEGRIPYGNTDQGTLYFGSTTVNDLGGSWEE